MIEFFFADADEDYGSQVINLDVALTPVMCLVSGYVVDIFEEFGIENAFIEIDDNGIIRETYSDETTMTGFLTHRGMIIVSCEL